MVEPWEELNTKRESWLDHIVRLRDKFLVIGSLVYLFGYLVWSHHAWRNHLGLLPALQTKYLLAGATPAILLAAAATLILQFDQTIWALIGLPKDPSRPEGMRGAAVSLFLVLTTFLGLLTLSVGQSIGEPLSLALQPYSAFIFLLSVIVPTLPMTGMTEVFNIDDYIVARTLSTFHAIVLCVGALSAYLTLIYPTLPQEFGGVRPRQAVLFVETEKMQHTGLTELFPISISPPNVKVIRSVTIDVLFSGSATLLIRPSGTMNDKSLKTPVYEIKRDIIQAIEWKD